jgi:NitT/TauT family transport system substrate-binding protein
MAPLSHVSRKAALAGLGATVLAPLAGRPAAAETGVPITLAAPPIDAAGTLFYAADLGLYEKAGLNVKITVFNNPGPIVAGVAAGSFTVAAIPISVAALAREKGLPIVMFAPLALYVSSSPTNAMIVLKNSPLRNASDLNGKTIAVRELVNMSYFGAKAWIDKNGGDSKSIKWVEISDTQAVAAMRAGRIDAASVSEPALDDSLHGDARVLGPVFDAIAKRFLINGVFTSEEFAKSSPDVIRKLADVIGAATHWANVNRVPSGAILAKYAQAPVLPGSTRMTYAERIRGAEIQPVLDLLLSNGVLKAPMRAADLVSSLISMS